ncbi:MAG: OmpA family protein [Deltaproteobacteria bacterium]
MSLGLSVATLGCAHAAVKPSLDQTPAPVARSTAPAPAAAPAANDEQQAIADLEAVVRSSVLHFAFNQDELTPESRTRLDRVAEVMKRHPAFHIRVDGNCDERGTEEFNLALGQRRAQVAKKYLVNLGVEPERVATISYGKDRPFADGHDESAWAQNRRDDFEPASQAAGGSASDTRGL